MDQCAGCSSLTETMRAPYVPALDQRFTVGHQYGELWLVASRSRLFTLYILTEENPARFDARERYIEASARAIDGPTRKQTMPSISTKFRMRATVKDVSDIL